jgi:hypothetical protein
VQYEKRKLACRTLYKLYLHTNSELILTSFLNLVLLLLNALGPSLHKLPFAPQKACVYLSSEPLMHLFLHFLAQGESAAAMSL